MAKNQKYSGLQSLISSDRQAKEFFVSLPDYVQGMIQQRSDSVNSLESLKDYADNLLRGDG